MADPIVHETGLISVENGSPGISGYGTAFIPACEPGDSIFIDTGSATYSAVIDTVSQPFGQDAMAMLFPWRGPSLSHVPFKVVRGPFHGDPVKAGPKLAEYLAVSKTLADNTTAAVQFVTDTAAQVALDKTAIADDRQQTGEDRIATADDRRQTGEDRVKTTDDRRQTGEDRVKTTDDRRQTGEDRVKTGQDRQAAADSAAAAADSAASLDTGNLLRKDQNLAGLTDKPLARQNLALKALAIQDTATIAQVQGLGTALSDKDTALAGAVADLTAAINAKTTLAAAKAIAKKQAIIFS